MHWPDDHNDAIKDIVGVSQILKEAKGGELEDHLQRKHAGKHYITNFQDISQLIGL